MEFFGLTSYGFSDPIKDMMRTDYKEPDKPPTNLLEDGDSGKNFCDRIKELDCYIGFTDGYAYKSWDRLSRMRTKYVFKPVGPYDMYRYSGATSMDYGWWQSDPVLASTLNTENWYKPRVFNPITTSEMSR
ncbi:hypothetical protein NQ314_020582 [Rhamnusium bicolor]|uniref:Uncharacterized protein n=1 Tax=Rhamnusium bicolor TaxID=1586634 RepID=A0AAV8WKN2_9CUCU|nr:hypothetical protein NQ314_020582 [Rhamnusium bicolor]